MKKILIYLNKNDLAPTGGPKGYNYNLLEGLNELNAKNDIQISFLSSASRTKEFNDKVDGIKNEKIKSFVKGCKSIYRKGRMMYGNNHISSLDFSEYDAIHFHITMDLYKVKDSLSNYKGKVILTSHTPTMPSKEVFSLLTDFEKKYMRWFYRKLSEVDMYAFNRADYIIFPCRDAEEPYYHEWPGYEKLHDINKNKYLYMTTGTGEKKACMSKEEVREKYKIPQDAFVISYVGRHNEIKGYDTLKTIGEKALHEHENVFVLVAGKEGPIYHLDHERWVEVGWTNDPGSIIKASDVFILPNKETYFDLIMLEALSFGQIVIASSTGGNKYFDKYGDSGIFLYNNNDECLSVIKRVISLDEKQREKLRQKNYEIYNSEFTNEEFAKRYMHILHKILD